MGKLQDIAFENQRTDIKNKVTSYWKKRTDTFFTLREDELNSHKAEQWLREITALIGNRQSLHILDAGCGTGFFEVLLGKQGHSVTGIDLTESMVENGNRMIEKYGLNTEIVKCLQMDAESLSFPDKSFDVVISRNLTWTLPHPHVAYSEWKRVLKTDGLLINFDAEYAKGAHNLTSPENIAHKNISTELKEECHQIYHMLTVSNLSRPEWDRHILEHLGFTDIKADTEFSDRMFAEHDEFYIPDRMFCISALNGGENNA